MVTSGKYNFNEKSTLLCIVRIICLKAKTAMHNFKELFIQKNTHERSR